MGPTCAKRAHLRPGEQDSWQLSFMGQLGEESRPQPAAKRLKFRHSARHTLPAHLYDRYVLAKIAFDELFREFCNNGSLLHGPAAEEMEQELLSGGCEEHSFKDPLLKWLEPEHELSLLIERETNTYFYCRSINGVLSILEIDPEQSLTAKMNISLITAFTQAIARHRESESMVQLSLIDFEDQTVNLSAKDPRRF